MSYNNHFLFSETYLNSILEKMNKDDLVEADEQFENILSWYREYKDAWEQFEDIMIDTLGYTKEPDGKFRVLYSDNSDPVAAAYLLDRDSDIGSTVKGKYYAVDAVRYAKKKNLDWVIVTNGMAWRLYSTNNVSPYEFYYESDIGDAIENGRPDENTHAFYRMFSAAFYYHNENKTCLMDVFKEESDAENEKIEDTLRSKAESILKGLCYGLKDNMNLSAFDESTRKQIYDDAIVLLYRLLFLGYAEARKLLPVTANDPEYQDSFSSLCQTARDYYMSGKLDTVGDDYDLWERLDSQLRAYVDKNYNGGLFSNDDKPILREYRIANKHLAICLMELAYISGRKNSYDQKIAYKDLSVRNLGAIYEGLLEYQLFIADELMVQRKSKDKVSYVKASGVRLTNSDRNNLVQPGEIYLSQDATERKETGAYYTPEDVVEYIVSQTVDKKLAELKDELDQELAELRDELSYEPVEQNRIMLRNKIDGKTEDFIRNKVLNLSIVDSAMGSGHFLVNAAYHVSNFIVNLLEENHWENEEVNADVSYWKRKVVENCIYGIDINYLSVLLARLSLWLISASNDKALSFIDHHLKCGNTLLGESLADIEYENPDAPIFNISKEQFMFPVLNLYKQIQETGSNTKDSVKKQERLYKEVQSYLSVLRSKLDYTLALKYEGISLDESQLYKVLSTDDASFFKKDDVMPFMTVAKTNHFFHWEIEFPEVYMKNGFDVMIGNPPYGANISEKDKTFFKIIYDKVHVRTPDTFNYFIKRAFDFLREGGMVSFIVPNNLLSQNEYLKTRRFLVGEKELMQVLNAGDNVFARASVPTCIFFAYNRTEKCNYNVKYIDVRNDKRNETLIEAKDILSVPGIIIGINNVGLTIMNKVRDKSVTISDIATEVSAGISTGGNDAFCINKNTIYVDRLEEDIIYPLLIGKDVDSYKTKLSDEYIIYTTKSVDIDAHPHILHRLEQYKGKLERKRETKKGTLPWWCLHWPRNPELFQGKKIIMRQTSDRIRATIDNNDYYILNSLLILKLKDDCDYSHETVLGVLNSKLCNFIYRSLTQEKGRGFAEVKPANVRKLYVPKLDEGLNQMIEAEVTLILGKNNNCYEHMDKIDRLLYNYYELNDDEIKYIESEFD